MFIVFNSFRFSLTRLVLILTVFVLFSAASRAAEWDIFLDSYSVELPHGVTISDPAFVPADEYRQQLSFVDADGAEATDRAVAAKARMVLLREVIVSHRDEVPDLLQFFVLMPRPLELGDRGLLEHRMNRSFFWLNRNDEKTAHTRPLLHLRLGESWWGFDEAARVGLAFDLTAPSFEICRVFGQEYICIHRIVEGETDWVSVLELDESDTRLTAETLTELLNMEYIQLPLEILQSVARTHSYEPCCRSLIAR